MLTSIIRTLLPILVAAIGPWATNWLGWTDVELTNVLTAVIAGAYYLAARGLEQLNPKLGVLLGIAVQPTYARDGRHELGRDEDGPGDTGAARMLTVSVVAVLFFVATALVVLSADQAKASPMPRRHLQVLPHVVSATNCDDTLLVTYGARVLVGRELRDRLDDGAVRLELLEVSGRSGPGGSWRKVQAASGGENHLRLPNFQPPGDHITQARIVRTSDSRIISAPALITTGCPA